MQALKVLVAAYKGRYLVVGEGFSGARVGLLAEVYLQNVVLIDDLSEHLRYEYHPLSSSLLRYY